jgi:hypothetical protein
MAVVGFEERSSRESERRRESRTSRGERGESEKKGERSEQEVRTDPCWDQATGGCVAWDQSGF